MCSEPDTTMSVVDATSLIEAIRRLPGVASCDLYETEGGRNSYRVSLKNGETLLVNLEEES